MPRKQTIIPLDFGLGSVDLTIARVRPDKVAKVYSEFNRHLLVATAALASAVRHRVRDRGKTADGRAGKKHVRSGDMWDSMQARLMGSGQVRVRFPRSSPSSDLKTPQERAESRGKQFAKFLQSKGAPHHVITKAVATYEANQAAKIQKAEKKRKRKVRNRIKAAQAHKSRRDVMMAASDSELDAYNGFLANLFSNAAFDGDFDPYTSANPALQYEMQRRANRG